MGNLVDKIYENDPAGYETVDVTEISNEIVSYIESEMCKDRIANKVSDLEL